MKNEAKKYKVHIFHHEYTIVSDESEEQVKKTASYVDALMKEIAVKAPTAEEQRVTVLAALRIAHELLAAQKTAQEYESKAAVLADSIDKVL